MQLPFSLPDWAPPWLGFVLVVAGALMLLALLVMPFSVFGLKGRLDGVEARLDEIQHEIRSLALRLPEPVRSDRGRADYAEDGPDGRRWTEPRTRPPIPPRMAEADRPPPPPTRRVQPIRQGRAEPRFDPE